MYPLMSEPPSPGAVQLTVAEPAVIALTVGAAGLSGAVGAGVTVRVAAVVVFVSPPRVKTARTCVPVSASVRPCRESSSQGTVAPDAAAVKIAVSPSTTEVSCGSCWIAKSSLIDCAGVRGSSPSASLGRWTFSHVRSPEATCTGDEPASVREAPD